MTKFYYFKSIFYGLLVLCLFHSLGFSSNRYSQLVLTFPETKKFKHYYSEAENSITLSVSNASAHDLSNLNNYDQSIIKRLIIKETLDGLEIKFVFQDRNIRTTIASFTEPFRIVLDFFDKDYTFSKDPKTGLPLYTTNVSDDESNNFYSYYDVPAQLTQLDSKNIDSTSDNSKKYRLMQPLNNVENIKSLEDLNVQINSADAQRGKYWSTYPPYIYKIITDIDQSTKDVNEFKLSQEDFQSELALANYAGKLFDSGRENHALIVYQYLLYRKPQVFDTNPTYLWKLAEVHLGAGNLTLAEGYYKLLIQKFPSSPLAKFSELRCLDIRSLLALKTRDNKAFENLKQQLSSNNYSNIAELEAQSLIRQAYWTYYSDPQNIKSIENVNIIPPITPQISQRLTTVYSHLENFYTKLLTASLLLNNMLEDKTPWQTSYGLFADNYFKTYGKENGEPFRSILLDKLKNKLISVISVKTIDAKYAEVIQLYQDLPPALKSIRKDVKASWFLGESYRKVGYKDEALKFYQITQSSTLNSIDKFKALFWIAHLSGELRNDLKDKNINSKKVVELGVLMEKSDIEALEVWNALSYEQKQEIEISFIKDVESNIFTEVLLKSAPSIVLDIWLKSYGTTAQSSLDVTNKATENSNILKHNTYAIKLFVSLAKRFAKLGMPAKRLQALSLLRYIQASQIQNKEDLQMWTDNMITLAEEYVNQNKFLEAGKIYEQAARAMVTTPYKAELLYKGGLLLYRAAQREDAIKAFTECSQDKNNIYYSNLCLQRLNQFNL